MMTATLVPNESHVHVFHVLNTCAPRSFVLHGSHARDPQNVVPDSNKKVGNSRQYTVFHVLWLARGAAAEYY